MNTIPEYGYIPAEVAWTLEYENQPRQRQDTAAAAARRAPSSQFDGGRVQAQAKQVCRAIGRRRGGGLACEGETKTA